MNLKQQERLQEMKAFNAFCGNIVLFSGYQQLRRPMQRLACCSLETVHGADGNDGKNKFRGRLAHKRDVKRRRMDDWQVVVEVTEKPRQKPAQCEKGWKRASFSRKLSQALKQALSGVHIDTPWAHEGLEFGDIVCSRSAAVFCYFDSTASPSGR